MKLIECNLSDIADIVAGQSPESKYYNKNKKGYPFLQGKTDFGKKYPSFSTWCTVAKRITQNKDILLSVRAPVGDVNIAKEEICIGRGIAAIRVKKKIFHEYVYYFLKFNQHYFKSFETGTTFKAISVQNIRKIPIKIPEEYNDQIKIANLLSKIENLLEKREKSIELLDSIIKSTFLDMFGDPIINNKKWKLTKCIDEADCIVPGRDKPKSFTGSIKWITTRDLKDKAILETEKVSIGLTSKEILEVRAKIIPKNSVIFTCVGDLGVVSIIDDDIVMNQQLHSFQCRENLNNIFLMFNISFQKQYMYKKASKTTVPYMNKTTCNNIPLILPPKDLQDKFADIAIKIENTKKIYEKSLNELKQLFNSTSQKAFKGELDLSVLTLEVEDKFPDILDEIVEKDERKNIHFEKADNFTKETISKLEEHQADDFTMDVLEFKKLIINILKYEQTFDELDKKIQSKDWIIPYDEDLNKKDKPFTYKNTIFELLKENQIVQEIIEYEEDDELKRKILLKAKK